MIGTKSTSKPSTRETLVDELSEEQLSAFRKYQQLYVGSRSITELLKYELLTTLFAALPGALGFTARKSFYRTLFGRAGRGVAIAPHVTLRCPGRIFLGDSVFVDEQAVLDAKGSDSRIDIGDVVLIGKDTIFSCASGSIKVGNDVSIGPGCFIRAGLSPISIGSQVTIGAQSVLVSGNPSYERLDVPMKAQVGACEGILVGDDVWMGVGVRVVDGVEVASGSVIGAGAVVLEDVPQYAIVAGVPAKVIGDRREAR